MRTLTARRMWGIAALAASGLALSACSPAPPLANVAERISEIEGPTCNLEGCCEGHGDVAYLAPDKFIMCTDGEASQICDCH